MIRLPTSTDESRNLRAFGLSFACVATFVSVHALAEPTGAERSLAAALFDQGRTLMGEGKFDEACTKLAESQRLDPGGGTLLNLALCHEKQGKIATAWTEFRDARAMAKKDKRPEREAAADAEIGKLEPQLSKISIVVSPDAKIDGLTIQIDGSPLSDAAWGIPFPVDPGTRSVIAKAPGYREWTGTVEIGKTAGTANVNIPKLEKEVTTTTSVVPTATGSNTSTAPIATASTSVLPPNADSDVPMNSRRKAGFAIGGLGLAFIGVGAVTGGLAIHNNNAANEICPKSECADSVAVDQSKTAVLLGNISTATFAVGLAGVAVGTILIVTAPKNAPLKASLSIGPQFVSVGGKF